MLPDAEPQECERLRSPDAPAEPTVPATWTPLPLLPGRLATEPPGWVQEADVLVIGSGIAGLTAALECADVLDALGGRVLVVTKDVVAAGSTPWAQGGIAFVQASRAAEVDPDTVAQHVHDTIVAGAGLCEPAAVEVLVSEGTGAVAELMARGAEFDRDDAGELHVTREGGHHRNRIAHAGGDATGAEIERALVAAVKDDPRIEIIEHALVLDLLPATTSRGRPGVAGATLHVMGEGSRGGVGAVHARAVVLASGGIGQIYAATTNPPVSTGDGVAAALRAGAELRDVEFIQFHPTVLYLGPGARGQLPLVSEAVRGEGAHLLNAAGQRFMLGTHELAELAPRDVVAKAIMTQLMLDGSDHVFVDGRMLGEETWRVRFPTILQSCRQAGINPVTDLIPVAPASHYFCGGVQTDLEGQTSLARLYAVGEVASTGVHGANRLASNSLLEGLVYARRIAVQLRTQAEQNGGLPDRLVPLDDPRPAGLMAREVMAPMQLLMSRYAGGLRSAAGLRRCAAGLAELAAVEPGEPALETWEASNLMAVATAVVAAARFREESRGAHWREDHPDPRPPWLGHQLIQQQSDGLAHKLVPVGTRSTPTATATPAATPAATARATA
ncbi:MAG: L-aspartate oxidase [Propionibacteriaceae bacterium]